MLTIFHSSKFQGFLCGILVLISFAPWAVAQKGQSGSNPNQPTPMRSSPGYSDLDQVPLTIRNPGDFSPKKTEETNCFLPPLDRIHNLTIGITALEMRKKARGEYEKVCNALGERKFEQAEKTLRTATEKFPDYSALWVLLGQVLENRQELQEARESCQHASSTNSSYVPAYLCLADIAARSGDWNEVSKQSEKALTLDSMSNSVIYLYDGLAKLNLHMLSQAEDSVKKGVDLDKAHPDPRMHYLLAQIYEARGDREDAMTQLRLCLKLSAGAKDEQAIKQYLSRLEQMPTNSPGIRQADPAAK